MKANKSGRKQKSDCLGMGNGDVRGGGREGDLKGLIGMFTNFDDGFMGIYMCQNLYTVC